jgi:ankyrin repeat protein
MPCNRERARVGRARPAILFACLAILGSCEAQTTFPSIADRESIRISLKRTACEGTCPVYRVQIAGDGRVDYMGVSNVAVIGAHNDYITPHDVDTLLKIFKDANFFSMADKYAIGATDLPTYETSLSLKGITKRVIDYGGNEVGMPQAMTGLENAVDRIGDTAKWVRGTSDLVPSLRREGMGIGSTSVSDILATAAANGSFEAVDALLAAGAHFSDTARSREALWLAAIRGHVQLVERLLDAGVAKRSVSSKVDALYASARRGDAQLVHLLISHGADAGQRSAVFRNSTVLMGAVESGNADVVALILNQHPDAQATDDEGRTAIFSARAANEANFARILRMLVDAGIDPNQRTRYGDTVLHEFCRIDVVTILVPLGADVNARNYRGATPLLAACSEEKALALMAAGADTQVRTDRDESILDRARQQKWRRVLSALGSS